MQAFVLCLKARKPHADCSHGKQDKMLAKSASTLSGHLMQEQPKSTCLWDLVSRDFLRIARAKPWLIFFFWWLKFKPTIMTLRIPIIQFS